MRWFSKVRDQYRISKIHIHRSYLQNTPPENLQLIVEARNYHILQFFEEEDLSRSNISKSFLA